MSATPEIEEWVERLKAARGEVDESFWSSFDALGEEERAAVVRALQEEVMAAVRTSPPRALPIGSILPRAARGLGVVAALADRAQAVALHANGRSEEAAAAYRRALATYEEAGDELQAARTRRSLVDVLQMAGHADEALAEGERARAVLARLEEWRLLAQLECNVGNVHFRLDRYAAARPHYERAQQLFEREGDAFGRAHVLFNLGNIETNSHDFDRAEASYRQAREVFAANGHEVLAADCDYSLGYLDFRRGRFREARAELLRAREGYRDGGKPSGAPLCELDLCELHLRVDAHYDAVAHGERAIQGFEGLGMRYEAAKARMLVGMALVSLRREAEGGAQLGRAARELAAVGNHTLGSLATLHRVPLSRSTLRARSVLPEVEAAATHLERSGDELLGQLARLALAEALSRAGERERARATLADLASQEDVGGYERLGLPNARIEALRALASVEMEGGQVRDAEQHLRAAVDWIDATLEHLTGGDARLAFFARRQPAFAELAALLLDRGDRAAVSEAVTLVERSRSRNGRQRRNEAGASSELRAAREEVDFLLRERWEAALEKGDSHPGGPRGITVATDAALLRAQERLLELDRRNRARTEGALAGWEDRAPSLGGLGEDDRVLYYLTSRGGTHAVLLAARDGRPEVLHVQRLGAIEEPLRRQVSRARYFVEKRQLGARYSPAQARAAHAGLASSLERIGELLLDPLEELGDERARGLVVVPYGILHSVPFAALGWRGAPLVSRLDVSVARSLDPLRGDRPHDLPERAVLSCGSSASDLPAIASELAKIDAVAGGAHRVLDPEAFFAALEEGRSASILHIPAHGSYEPEHPLFAGLRLGERLLAAFDVARLRLPPCLVVLSGCETGRQGIPNGEELYGPEQAFLAAGALGVLGTSWPISDEGGADLIAGFMERFLAGTPAGAALSSVQREAWKAGAPLEDWTSLVYSGDPHLRVPRDASPSGHRSVR